MSLPMHSPYYPSPHMHHHHHHQHHHQQQHHHSHHGFQNPYSPQVGGYYPPQQPMQNDFVTQDMLYTTLAATLTPQVASILLDEYLRVTHVNPAAISLRRVLSEMKQNAEIYADHLLTVIQNEAYTLEVLKFAIKNRLEVTIAAVIDDAQMSLIMSRGTRASLLELLLDDDELVRTYHGTYTTPSHGFNVGTGMSGNSPYRSARVTGAYSTNNSANVTPLHDLARERELEAKIPMLPGAPTSAGEVRTPCSLASVPSWASLSSSWADEVEEMARLGDDDEDDELGMEDMLDLAKQSMETQEHALSEFDTFLHSIGLLHLSGSLKEIRITDVASLRRGVHMQSFRRVVPVAADRERIAAAIEAVAPSNATSKLQTKPVAATNYLAPNGKGTHGQNNKPQGHPRPHGARSWDEAKDQHRTVYVRNLQNLSDEAVRAYFAAFGEVQDLRYMYDPNTQAFLGYAFVMFATAQQADNVLRYTGNHIIDGTTVTVKAASNPTGANHGRERGGGGGHATSPQQQAPRQNNSGGANNNAGQPCRYYKSSQGCKFGTSCTFMHS
jgi:hypothetical protein